MRPISYSSKRRVLNLWLDGEGYRTIRQQTGVSTGATSGVIEEMRIEMPDLDELRTLNILLKESHLSVEQVRVGANLMSPLIKLNIGEEEAAQAISQITQYGEKAPKILAEGQTLLKLEKETGIKYNQLASKYQRMREDVLQLKQEKKELKDEIERLQESLTHLQALKTLQDKLQQHTLTIKMMDQFIENNAKLEEKGFTPSVAETLSTELAKHGINPKKAAEIVSEATVEYQSLGKAITEAKRELEEKERKKEDAEHKKELLEKDVRSLDKQIETKTNIRDDIDRSIEVKKSLMDLKLEEYWRKQKDWYSKLDKEKKAESDEKTRVNQAEITALEEKKRNLEQEVERRVKEVEEEPEKRKKKLEDENRALEEEKKKLQQEVKHLQKEYEYAEKVEEKIKKMDEELQKRESLTKMSALLRDPKASKKPENLEVILVVLKNIISFGGLGDIWSYNKPENVKLTEDLIKVLGEKIRSG